MRFCLVVLLWSGCAESVLRPSHVALSVEKLVPDGAALRSAVSMVVEPVSLGHFTNRAAFSDGTRPMIAARVVTTPPVNGKWSMAPDIEPRVVGSARWPRFEARTVPILPYGSFWIEITNHDKAALFVSPRQLTLMLGKKRVVAAEDEAAKQLWTTTLASYPKQHLGSPWIDVELLTAHGTLPVFDKDIQISPGNTWRGFATFDVGAYTADDYDATLALDGRAEVVLAVGDRPAARQSFRVTTETLRAVCLPSTHRPRNDRCEVVESISSK